MEFHFLYINSSRLIFFVNLFILINDLTFIFYRLNFNSKFKTQTKKCNGKESKVDQQNEQKHSLLPYGRTSYSLAPIY